MTPDEMLQQLKPGKRYSADELRDMLGVNQHYFAAIMRHLRQLGKIKRIHRQPNYYKLNEPRP